VVLLRIFPRARRRDAPSRLLGDRYGRKKVLLFSMALFGIGSVACAYSTSVLELMAAQALIGLAGAGLIVMAFRALRLGDPRVRALAGALCRSMLSAIGIADKSAP
jgi:MFS family permease